MSLSYETATGALSLHIRFFRPLADPTQTSALRQAFVEVELGDLYEGTSLLGCGHGGGHGLFIQAELGNAEPPIVSYGRFEPLQATVQTTKVFSPDRSELELTAQGPGLAGLNLICAKIAAANNAEKDASFYSHSFLLEGFTVFDGDPEWSAATNVSEEARFVNNDLGRRGERFLETEGGPHGFACHGGGYLYSCSGKRRMKAIVGVPTLFLRGSQTFEFHPGVLGETMTWNHDERATLAWSRCPSSLRIAHVRAGHPCSLVVKWRSGTLWPLFERPGLRGVRLK